MNLRALSLSLLSALAACGDDHPDPSIGDESASIGSRKDGGTTSTSGKADASIKHDSSVTTVNGGSPSNTDGGSTGDGTNVCSSHVIQATAIVPDMQIVLDASLSMAPLRWAPSTAAVSMLVNQYQSQISFGLELFPTGGLPLSCSVTTPEVPLALNNADKITQVINSTAPAGATPTAPALNAAAMVLGDRSQPVGDNATGANPGYVLLVTDGEPDCGSVDPIGDATNAVMALAQKGIKTYVVGYQIDPVGQTAMNQWAQIGGTNMMYPVEDAQSLQDAFAAITKDLVSCSFDLSEMPADPSYVSVTIDGKQAYINTADGWVINGLHVTLQGQSCDTLKDGQTHTLKATVECTQVIAL